MSVAIVTDSTSDLTPDRAAAEGIEVVPLFVQFGDRRYRDLLDLSRAEFYRHLAAERVLPTTSQPTSAMFEDVFRPHAAAGRPVVCVTIAGALSGTINAATAAAAQFPGAEIRLIDSGTVAGGLALQALHAAELARTDAEAGAIVAALAADAAQEAGYAIIPDLSHAVRTGRVSRTMAMIGSLVKVLPILTIGGNAVGRAGTVRTFARAKATLVEHALALANRADGARIAVVHADAPALAEELLGALRAGLTTAPRAIETAEVGPVVATHAGPGAAGIFVVPG